MFDNGKQIYEYQLSSIQIPLSQCLKIAQKVAFNIVSEASYVYILSEQKFIKMLKMFNLASFRKREVCGQTVLPDKSILIRQKLVENAKMPKIEMRLFFIVFQTLCKFLSANYGKMSHFVTKKMVMPSKMIFLPIVY